MIIDYLFCFKKTHNVTEKCKKDEIRDYGSKIDKRNGNCFLSNLFLGWVFPIIVTGNRRNIDEKDLVEPHEKYDSETVGNVLENKINVKHTSHLPNSTLEDFNEFVAECLSGQDTIEMDKVTESENTIIIFPTEPLYWYAETEYCKLKNKKPSLTKAVWKAFGLSFIPSGILVLATCLFRIATPIVFTSLITYWSVDSNMTRTTAIYYSVSLVILVALSIMCQHHSSLDIYNFGMKLRVACTSILYRKLLRMNQSSLNKVAAGKLINLMSNDVAKFDHAFLNLHYLWVVPIQICIVLYFLYKLAGYPPIAGFLIMILFLTPSQALLTKLTANVRKQFAQRSDARIKLMNEIVNGIQVIKMYAWEKPFQEIVKNVRKREISYLRKSLAIMFTFVGMIHYSDRVSLLVTMVIMYYNGALAAATLVFPIQQYFGIFQLYLTLNIPLALGNYTELHVSLKRIEKILLMAETDENSEITKEFYREKYFTPTLTSKHIKNQKKKSEFAVELKDISASWDPSDQKLLKNIRLKLQTGTLNIIIGPVGSGKTSLFQVLLKELTPISGKLVFNGSVSYASQESWIFSDTVRENIIFGSPLVPNKYLQVCQVCCLNPDFEQFSDGDLTLVGERGVTLSGGQRARINLARGYLQYLADIYLLDDPLSAVDTHVANALFNDCINGYLKNKTRILITHQTHFIKVADKIIVMNEGKIESQGKYSELIQDDSTKQIIGCDENTESETNEDEIKLTSMLHETKEAHELHQLRDGSNEIEKEFRAKGNLSHKVFFKYFSAVNRCFITFLAFLSLISTQAFGTVCDYSVSIWTNEVERYKHNYSGYEIPLPDLDVKLNTLSSKELFIVFGGLLVIQIVLTNIRIFPLVSMLTRASSNIHNKMFKNVINAKMMLFNTSPPGRILNRFSKDLGIMDDVMPRSFVIMSTIYLQLIGALIINALSLTWTLIPTAVLIVIFIIFLKYNLLPTQATKRLENTTKSPVLGKINTTFNGITTIRCNKAEKKLIKEFDETQNVHSNAFYTYNGCTVAMAMYLDFLCVIYLMAIICIFLFTDIGLSLEVGFIGIAISQTMVLTQKLQAAAKFTTDYMGQMTSVERALEYTKLPVEDDVKTEVSLLPNNWPKRGSLSFKQFSLSYNATKVLKNISFDIKNGWKVGVVGRTGAGKSSLISGLFQLYDIEGTILIDGVDTSLIPKQELRSKISIIPQEPMLFSATIRYNLDPFNLYSDDAIWKALEQVELKSVIPSLDHNISEGGTNFSVGQRQLICLARAILRSNKILVMDEATANVDHQTDALIQRTIKQLFADCTVITIAHRLNTIMDSDRILVLEQGQLIEYDHPYVLLSNTESLFYSMVQKTGKNMTEKLLDKANVKYQEMESYDL